MSELDAEVRKWRTERERRSSLSVRELDELEDHLRARVSLELDLNPALTPVKAFTVAVTALGEPKTISREFSKAGQPRWRRLLLTGWALYAASFLLPALWLPEGVPPPGTALTIYGYEIIPMWIQLSPGGIVPAFEVWLPNLIMLVTLSALLRLRPTRRPWTAWIVGSTGALPLCVGLARLVSPGLGFYPGVGYWLWAASFVVVATALWLRNREWLPAETQVLAD